MTGLIIAIFVTGYIAIASENLIKINKAAIALLTGVKGMEKIRFNWYLKKFSLVALIGYFAGAGMYILQHYLFG